MNKQTAKLIAVIAENLPEMSDDLMQGWIENPKGLQKNLKNALCPPEATPDFKVWKTIKLGTNGLKTANDFRKSIKGCGMKISDYANDILGRPQFTAAIKETEVDLVVVSVAELGFKDGAMLKDIHARAKDLGLELCPNEVGPQLRLQYEDQSKGEWLVVGMEPIPDSDDHLKLFSVGRRGYYLWLYSHCDSSDGFWSGDSRFVFVLPRK